MPSVRQSSLTRFVHWGPILSISKFLNIRLNTFLVLLFDFSCISVIYKFVTLTTLYFTEMWRPCFGSLGGFLNNVLLLTLFVISFSCYLKCVIVGPGFLPLKWKPVLYNWHFSIDKTLNLIFVSQELEKDQQYLQFCTICDGFKAPRVHHCHKCTNLKFFKLLNYYLLVCSICFKIIN